MASINWEAQLILYLPKIGVDPSQVPGTLLASLGTACQAAIEREISRTFDEVAYVEVYNGSGSPILYLNHDPITALVSVSLYGNALTVQPDPTVVPTYPLPQVIADGSPIRNKIRRTDSGAFSQDSSNVIVSYKAGLSNRASPVPPDLVFAVTYWAALFFQNRSHVGVSTHTFKEQITGFTNVVPPDIDRMIWGWQRTSLS